MASPDVFSVLEEFAKRADAIAQTRAAVGDSKASEWLDKAGKLRCAADLIRIQAETIESLRKSFDEMAGPVTERIDKQAEKIELMLVSNTAHLARVQTLVAEVERLRELEAKALLVDELYDHELGIVWLRRTVPDGEVDYSSRLVEMREVLRKGRKPVEAKGERG